jgi:predicted nucleic acid-binding protein
MLMKILIDTDVILDFFLNRQPFVTQAAALWQANRSGQFEGFVAAITPINLYYIGRKALGADQAKQAVQNLLAEFKVCPVDHTVLEAARLSAISDFEDAVQHESAVASGLDMIVTRNLSDYNSATLKVFSPATFLGQLPSAASPGNMP